jgi:hypothetical protein
MVNFLLAGSNILDVMGIFYSSKIVYSLQKITCLEINICVVDEVNKSL